VLSVRWHAQVLEWSIVNANASFKHQRAAIISVEAVEAPEIITSDWIDEQLGELYQRWGMRPGLLNELAGIKERRWWPEGVTFDQAAAQAGRKAIATSGVDPSEIGMLISTSVCKHHLEPSVACAVHHQLGLSSACINFDLANACLGFINAIHLASTAIDGGFIKYALIVDGEGSRHTQQATIARLQSEGAAVTDMFDEFASLTLGSGAAAMVLGSIEDHPDGHRVIGGMARAATEHHTLCVGNLEKMTTDTKRLLEAGLDLAEIAWKEAITQFDWAEGMDHYILHQVSSVHTRMLCERLGIDQAKAPLTYPHYGNVGPAAIPITLAGAQDTIKRGERVLCMGIGSGLNTSLTEIVW
jgi:acyl-CoA:acyl-CoA alkyltransferase